ncbi:unnamed protein product [Amoebophrya sp. A25]|nr:unnamed protein product [Amoebophrya sp. A25]|eukprot:GSA25T00021973001.1
MSSNTTRGDKASRKEDKVTALQSSPPKTAQKSPTKKKLTKAEFRSSQDVFAAAMIANINNNVSYNKNNDSTSVKKELVEQEENNDEQLVLMNDMMKGVSGRKLVQEQMLTVAKKPKKKNNSKSDLLLESDDFEGYRSPSKHGRNPSKHGHYYNEVDGILCPMPFPDRQSDVCLDGLARRERASPSPCRSKNKTRTTVKKLGLLGDDGDNISELQLDDQALDPDLFGSTGKRYHGMRFSPPKSLRHCSTYNAISKRIDPPSARKHAPASSSGHNKYVPKDPVEMPDTAAFERSKPLNKNKRPQAASPMDEMELDDFFGDVGVKGKKFNKKTDKSILMDPELLESSSGDSGKKVETEVEGNDEKKAETNTKSTKMTLFLGKPLVYKKNIPGVNDDAESEYGYFPSGGVDTDEDPLNWADLEDLNFSNDPRFYACDHITTKFERLRPLLKDYGKQVQTMMETHEDLMAVFNEIKNNQMALKAGLTRMRNRYQAQKETTLHIVKETL